MKAEDIAKKLTQERAAVDADLETVKREREVIKREHSKLLEGQRELIDQTRRLTFREREIEQREGELTREEHRVGVLVAEAERREQLVTDQETRIEAGKLALLRERRELEDDRKALEQQRARIWWFLRPLARSRFSAKMSKLQIYLLALFSTS